MKLWLIQNIEIPEDFLVDKTVQEEESVNQAAEGLIGTRILALVVGQGKAKVVAEVAVEIDK